MLSPGEREQEGPRCVFRAVLIGLCLSGEGGWVRHRQHRGACLTAASLLSLNPDGASQVLHLIANPEALALKAAEESASLALSAERDALEAQVVELQARLDAAGVAAGGGEAAPGSATPASAAPSPAGGARQIAVLEAEKVVLQRQVAEIEKRELRLKEVFRERIQVRRC